MRILDGEIRIQRMLTQSASTLIRGMAKGKKRGSIDYAKRNNLMLYNCLELIVRQPKSP